MGVNTPKQNNLNNSCCYQDGNKASHHDAADPDNVISVH
jgi:hypothetical protein